MKFYLFTRSKFPRHAIIFANSSDEAKQFYNTYIDDTDKFPDSIDSVLALLNIIQTSNSLFDLKQIAKDLEFALSNKRTTLVQIY